MAYCSELVTDFNLFYRGGNLCIPLYLYPSAESFDMLSRAKCPNLSDWVLRKLSAQYGFRPAPEEVLAYIYAVLYSPSYRRKYADELRADFPRIPFSSDPQVFRQMAVLGQELIDLHLLRRLPQLPGVKYHGTGSDKIEFVRYEPAEGRAAINKDKYFDGITPEIWAYRIGGYQVLKKYLEDRKGRSMDDPIRYIRIATAIARTIEIQGQTDTLYSRAETAVLP